MTDPWLVQITENNSEKAQNGSCSSAVETADLETSSDSKDSTSNLEFEDNFTQAQIGNAKKSEICAENGNEHQPLPDSAVYLQGLENKLEKLRKGSKLVEALAAKREDCMRTLLTDNGQTLRADANDELNTPTGNGDSAVQEIYRHLQPVQPITVGETVHILNYDQLDEEPDEVTEEEESERSQ